jgi:hypothetical protein
VPGYCHAVDLDIHLALVAHVAHGFGVADVTIELAVVADVLADQRAFAVRAAGDVDFAVIAVSPVLTG